MSIAAPCDATSTIFCQARCDFSSPKSGNTPSGEGGIRTLDGLLTHTRLAGGRLQPLGHLSRTLARSCQPPPMLHDERCLRRRWDSNPRSFRLPVFKTGALNHSATPPEKEFGTERSVVMPQGPTTRNPFLTSFSRKTALQKKCDKNKTWHRVCCVFSPSHERAGPSKSHDFRKNCPHCFPGSALCVS